MYLLKSVILIIIILFFGITNVFAQTAEIALNALKKIDSKIRVGITFNDYLKEVGDAKHQVNLFLENKALDSYVKTKTNIRNIMIHFEVVANAWKLKIKGKRYITRDLFGDNQLHDTIVKHYPMVKPSSEYFRRESSNFEIDDAMQLIWLQASEEIKVASKILEEEKQQIEQEASWWHKFMKFIRK